MAVWYMKTSFNKKLGLRIRELRLAKNLKQGELADMLNMERSNLTRIESGKQRPNDDNLEKLALILDVELKDLFDFNHIKLTKKQLIEKINKILSGFDTSEISYIYKSVQNLQQMKK